VLALALVVAVGVLDSFRTPENQFTGWAYVKLVRLYQIVGRPLLRNQVKCRYCPTCSEYSIEAVEKHGIRWGFVLTCTRLLSCQGSVPMGTIDPVPEPEE
jgi:putative membrane protein insertion efficiency factor